MSEIGLALAAAFAVGLPALGTAIGMGKVVSVMCKGVGRSEEASKILMTPFIVGVAIMESVVIYGLVIAFILVTK